MKKSSAVMLFLAIVLCCFLSGCASLLKDERMEQEVANFIDALNADDADKIFLSMYPDAVTREEFDASYETVREIWEKSDDYTLKLHSINTNKNINNSSVSTVCRAQYYVYTQDNSYTITLTRLSDDNGEGLSQFNLVVGTVPVLVSGGFTTASENSPLQWGMLIFCILSYLFVIVTVVDILRKRPRLFGLWLIAACAFLCIQMQLVSGNFHIGVGVYPFAISAFKIYSNGGRNFVAALPAGAVIYWCMRRKLQRFK
ncbi:MAG: hypothetical protein K2N90_02360 [Lachnospiraceae bacterium]|nr:hypothetical protein [Lachnospiraceae bacterium]